MTGPGPWLRYLRYVPLRRLAGRIAHEARLRSASLRTAERRRAGDLENPDVIGLGLFARRYRPLGDRFTAAERLYGGVFESKGIEWDFGSVAGISWTQPFEDPRFEHWEHDLVFFSHLLPLVTKDAGRALGLAADLCGNLDRSAPRSFGRKPSFAFRPIALSLRIMALWAALAGAEEESVAASEEDVVVIVTHLRRCERLLAWTLEKHLGFNHIVFGSAALAVSDSAWGRTDLTNLRRAVAELEDRTLQDGFWVERSPTYHIHMLFIARALEALEQPDAIRARLKLLIGRMTEALDVTVHPDGEIAVFNDSSLEDGVAPSIVGWNPDPVPSGKKILGEAGFAKLWNETFTVIMDAGAMGPDEVIGHGHADFLSFELSVAGHRLFVDPGVASISGGPARVWTRSAHTHNGPTIEGLEPAEFFGTWRVGRRGTASFTDTGSPRSLAGECDGYLKQGGKVSRSVEVRGPVLSWADSWEHECGRTRRSSFLIAEGWQVSVEAAGVVRLVNKSHGLRCRLTVSGADVSTTQDEVYTYGPMAASPATRLTLTASELTVSSDLTLD